jgi:hypothetical protein
MKTALPLQIVALVALALPCAASIAQTLRGADGPAATAPTPRVGDRWVYHATDGYRKAVAWDETYEVAAIGSEGITVKVGVAGKDLSHTRTEIWSAPGVLAQGAIYEAETRRFDPPWIRYKYPMATGDTWSQSIRDPGRETGPYGPLQSKVTVGGYEQVKTPAGTFNALKLRYFVRLDDETFWRYPTECDYFVWYAPELGVPVRVQKRSSWREKGRSAAGASANNFGQRAIYELVSFKRGS